MVSLPIGGYCMKVCTISNEEMKMIYKKVGLNVKKARHAKKVSQLTLALAIGHKAVGVVSMAELCTNNKHFNIEHLMKIAQVLEVDVCDFFKDV